MSDHNEHSGVLTDGVDKSKEKLSLRYEPEPEQLTEEEHDVFVAAVKFHDRNE